MTRSASRMHYSRRIRGGISSASTYLWDIDSAVGKLPCCTCSMGPFPLSDSLPCPATHQFRRQCRPAARPRPLSASNKRRRIIPWPHERQYRCREVADDRIFDAVEIRPALLPVIRIARHLDVLVRLERDKFKWARADRMLAHVARRNMTGIDRGISGSEQREKGRLRPSEMKRDLVIAVGSNCR